ncbi:MAG: glutamate--tRNA ligase [Candidatus Berkelbacteria bacterium]|nr:glutamate--tRNA ligase [Candidatus Berkelbacteria bacterium]
MKSIITRFAPSPTGELHIGSARTALFAYLAARSTGGKFFLRIEDTDRTRYVEGSDQRLIEAMNWLNLIPDNKGEIVFQSKRLEMYKKFALELVEKGQAYICVCSKEKLDADRAEMEKAGVPPRYAGHCREARINIDDVKEGEYVVRLKMPKTGKIVVHDIVRGDIEFDLSLLDDQVLLKSDGFPTYHLASVVDDHEMGINSVLRAEEWLSSTPKHIILYQAFGWELPQFGHFSMILAPDRSKLSKRHGATSVEQFRSEGYLPEALINFVALLGWNPKTDREIFSLAELEQEFKIENLNKAPAIFDIQKLNSINTHYITELVRNQKSEVRSQIKNILKDISDDELDLIGRGGFSTLKGAADYILELRKEPDYPATMLVFKRSEKKSTLLALRAVADKFESEEEWSTFNVQKALEYVVIENSLTNGDVFWPVRVALSGAEKSPSPVELAVALGKDESLKRVKKAISKLN